MGLFGSLRKRMGSNRGSGGGKKALNKTLPPSPERPLVGDHTSRMDDSDVLGDDLLLSQQHSAASTGPANTTVASTKVGSKLTESTIHQSNTTATTTAARAPTSTNPLHQVPELILVLQNTASPTGEAAAQALHTLFQLSEPTFMPDVRQDMIRGHYQRLVPALLEFLTDCKPSGSEQYLVLLILNNLSMPPANKKLLAWDYKAAQLLCTLLCADPSNHMIAIILTNLTFAEAELRSRLVAAPWSCDLVNSLALALQMAALTGPELLELSEVLSSLDNTIAPGKRLTRIHAAASSKTSTTPLSSDKRFCHEHTPKWCLSALKNLTRPGKDLTACHAVMKSGILPTILRMIMLDNDAAAAVWPQNSTQDLALYVLVQLAVVPSVHAYLVDKLGAVTVLSRIVNSALPDAGGAADADVAMLQLQKLKARMALSYLLASEGYYGQANFKGTYQAPLDPEAALVLRLSDGEADLLLELLRNMMLRNGKKGPAGYSAAALSVKLLLVGLRCLLTQQHNRALIADRCGLGLNMLLMKALAFHALDHSSFVDPEAAEAASFTLYLQSSYGFKLPFLSRTMQDKDMKQSLFAKILMAYWRAPTTTTAGSHAVNQLLLRRKYLQFAGEMEHGLSNRLLDKIRVVEVAEQKEGDKPLLESLEKPIMRLAANGATGPTERYNNALAATQDLSFGCAKVRHTQTIDELKMANTMVQASYGERTQAYGYAWAFAPEMYDEEESPVAETSSATKATGLRTFFLCGGGGPFNLCANDTTVR